MWYHRDVSQVKLWIFPEGTRHNTGEIHPFKKGAFHMAIRSQLPILPVVFSSYYFLSAEEKRFDSGKKPWWSLIAKVTRKNRFIKKFSFEFSMIRVRRSKSRYLMAKIYRSRCFLHIFFIQLIRKVTRKDWFVKRYTFKLILGDLWSCRYVFLHEETSQTVFL